MSVTIFHNPRCSKSRQTLKMLQERGIDPEIVEYLKTPPTTERLEEILGLLGMDPRQLMRTGESIYKEQNLVDSSLSRAALVQAMSDHPILIERPIVLANNKAALGRPPENVLEIV